MPSMTSVAMSPVAPVGSPETFRGHDLLVRGAGGGVVMVARIQSNKSGIGVALIVFIALDC